MSELQAFLAIERSMGRVGYNACQHKLAPLEKQVHHAAINGNHAKAADLIEAINLRPEIAKVEAHLKVFMKSAFMLGASLACGGLDRTPKKAIKLFAPDLLDKVVKVHAEIVTLRNEQLIRRYAGNVIADHHADHNHATKSERRLRKEEEQDLADMLNNAVDGTTKMMSSLSANLSTSRLVSYGFLATADQIGVRKYQLQAILDDRTSQICQELDGRIFEVQRALDYSQSVLETTDPESLKSVAPFLKGTRSAIAQLAESSDSELQAQGVMVPPFHPNCYVAGTRVFTRRGFVEFKDLDVSTDEFLTIHPETRKLEWVGGASYIEHPYSGPMIRLTNDQRSVSMVVTPDHRLFYDRRTDRGGKGRVWETAFGDMAEITRAENKLYVTSVPVEGEDFIAGINAVDVCRFLGCYLSEGYMHGRYPCIVQYKPASRALMVSWCRKVGAIRHWSNRFQVKPIGLYGILKECGDGTFNKTIPHAVFSASLEARRAFLEAFMLGDGHSRIEDCFGWSARENVYTTSSPALRDDLVRLLISIGRSVSFDTRLPKEVQHKNGKYTAKNPQFVVRELTSKRRSARVVEETYDGPVYDVSLPRNHTLLIEYDGRIAWGSNCRTTLALLDDGSGSDNSSELDPSSDFFGAFD